MTNKNKSLRINKASTKVERFEDDSVEQALRAFAIKRNLRIGQRYITGNEVVDRHGGFWKRAILHDDAKGTHRRVWFYAGEWKYA